MLVGINLTVIFSIVCSGLISPQEVQADAGEPAAISPLPAAELRAVDVLPRPGSSDVDPESAVVVTFDQPVVPLTDDGSNLLTAFSIQPAAEGHAKWLNTSTYIFYPDPPLTGGIAYQVMLNAGLTSTVGAGLASGEDEITGWSFSTAAPRLASISPNAEGGTIDLDQEFELVFNQRMDPDSVQENLWLQDGQGNNESGTFTWEDENTVLIFTPSQILARDTTYRLILSGQAASAGGTRLGESTVQAFTTVPVLDVIGTNRGEGELLKSDSYRSFIIQMSAPVETHQKMAELVQISPAVENSRVTVGYQPDKIFVDGYFAPDQTYTITLSADLQDKWGRPAARERRLIFRTAPATPGLFIPMVQVGQNTLFLTPDETGLTAQAVNVKDVSFMTASLSLETFFSFSGDLYRNWSEYSFPESTTWQTSLDLPANRSTIVELPLSESLQSLPTGLYYYQLTSPEITDDYRAPRPFLAVVSPINLTLKRSADEVFVWAVDLRTQTPFAGQEVRFYDAYSNALGQTVTDVEGLCRLTIPAEMDAYAALFAVIGNPGDADFAIAADSWTFAAAAWYFGIPNWSYSQDLTTYLYTDRPIYRPGQTVNFRLVMREKQDGGFAPPPTWPVTVKMEGDYSEGVSGRPEIGTANLVLSSYGSAAGAITLPEDAAPGYYNLSVDADPNAWLSFQVAEYRKPEVELQVSFAKKDWLAGEFVEANVQAAYYFGAPARDLHLAWTLYSKPTYFSLPSGYQTGALATSWLNPREDAEYYPDPALGVMIASGEQNTDANGSVKINLSAEDWIASVDTLNRQLLTLEVNLMDENESPVSASGSASLHPADFYIGLRSEAWVGKAGVEAGFRVQTVDWQKKPSGGHALQAQFQKVTWEETGLAEWSQPYGRNRQPVYTPVSSADLITDGQGRARLAFTPSEPGTYVLKVFAEGVRSEIVVWVGGSSGAQWPNLPQQELRLTAEKTAYKPGEVARVLIPNPLGGQTLALITVEREKVLSAQVVKVEGSSYLWELPLTDVHSPNVFVAVTLLGQKPDGTPDFRQGFLELDVAPVEQTLEVELLTTPNRSEPGGEITFDIQVRDSYGQPVQGEFSLGVVDKAVLALAEPNASGILEAFYAPRALGVQNALNLALAANRITLVQADGLGGGGGQAILPPSVREDFPDTALWQGSVETNADGIAKVKMTLPDNLTTWVADLRLVTKDTKVGSAGSEIVVSKPLLIRPQTPRFFVAGDHTALRAVVHNNTPQELTVDVSLQAVGVALDDGTVSMQSITLASGGRQTVTWWGTVQETEEVGLVFQAVSGGLQDAARPEQGMLPVLRYQVPASFVTAGLLADAGEQVETIQMPTSFTPVGGDLQVELSPSLAANVIREMEALKAFPYDFTEPLVSHLLPNLELYRAAQELDLTIPGLESDLQEEIDRSLDRLLRYQNEDGGWGWTTGRESDEYITAYVLFGLGRARLAGVFVPQEKEQRAGEYLYSVLASPEESAPSWQLDRLVFQYFALYQSSGQGFDLEPLYAQREKLAPWSQALLALMINRENVADQRAYDLLSNLESTARRSAGGAHWEDRDDSSRYNFSSAHFNTAVVVVAIARMDPASALLRDGMRYLVTQRANGGGWASSYETAWVLMGLIESMKATSDFNPRYSYAADLNGKTLLSGGVDSGNRLTPVSSFVPLTDLQGEALNELRISREDGSGNLYYRALLNLERPAEEAEAKQNGLSITRSYHGIGAACTPESCPMIEGLTLGSESGVAEVRLTLTLPEEMSYLVVEDFIPAGVEIIDPQLKTSQAEVIAYDPRDPFGNGWGWWYFNDAQVYDDHVRWIGQRVPAGTYVLTYHLQAVQAGEYRTLPARAYEYYFPDVRGNTAGGVFAIE